jgi:hypothetical protein
MDVGINGFIANNFRVLQKLEEMWAELMVYVVLISLKHCTNCWTGSCTLLSLIALDENYIGEKLPEGQIGLALAIYSQKHLRR